MVTTNEKKRYVRIPTPLKRESAGHLAPKWANLIALHKRSIEREKRILRINEYGLLWIQFFRGAIVALILERLLFH